MVKQWEQETNREMVQKSIDIQIADQQRSIESPLSSGSSLRSIGSPLSSGSSQRSIESPLSQLQISEALAEEIRKNVFVYVATHIDQKNIEYRNELLYYGGVR